MAKKSVSKKSFEELLNRLEISDFQKFIKEYSKKNKMFKTEFELYFASGENSDLEEKYQKLIGKSLHPKTNKWGNVLNLSDISKEYKNFVKEMSDFFAQNNFRDSFLLCKILLPKLASLLSILEYGYTPFYGYVQRIVEVLEHLAAMAPYDLRAKIFQFLEQELLNDFYYETQSGKILVEILKKLAVSLQKNEDFIRFIDEKIKEESKEAYPEGFFVLQKIDFLQKIGEIEQYKQLMEQNLHFHKVKIQKAKFLITENELVSAKNMISSEIDKVKKDFYNNSELIWENLLLQIAEKEQDISEIRRINKKFTFFEKQVDSQYYLRWRETFSSQEWIQEIDNEIDIQLKTPLDKYERYAPKNHYLLKRVGFLLVSEKRIQIIWDLLKESIYDDYLEYVPYISDNFPDEITEKLLPMLEKQADIISEREKYRRLADQIAFFIQYLPKNRAKFYEMAQKIIQKYPKRKAMIEEFEKNGF